MEQSPEPELPDDLDRLARWPVGRLLSTAARRVEREWNAHLASWDLNHASLPVLVLLSRAPHTQRQLAAACGVTEQTMSRILARLERTGYVVRAQHEADRRKHVITITDPGRAAVAAAADPGPADALVTRGLTPAQARQLRELLAVVAAGAPSPPTPPGPAAPTPGAPTPTPPAGRSAPPDRPGLP
ncbi:MarR family winged helix-turn-helix transcriptional regulator [Cellulomonas hominis]